MQKLSQRTLLELRRRRPVLPIVFDCPRLLLPAFLAWVLVRLFVELAFSRSRPQVVHFGDPLLAVAAPLCRAWGVPTVVTAHGLDITYRNRLYQRLLDVSVRHVGLFICISRAAREACLRRGVPPEKCVVITPGVDRPGLARTREARGELGRRLGVDLADSIVLLTVGRLVPRKGVAWFVEAVLPTLARVQPSVRYLVVGDGPERGLIEAIVARAGLADHVTLAGRVDDELLSLCFAGADVFVMPNVIVEGDMEGFGLVALEAAVAGLVVVASDVEGIRDAVTHGANGVLVPSGDAAAYTQVLLSLATDADKRVELGELAASYTLANHSWGSMADEYVSWYDTLANGRMPDAEAGQLVENR